MEQAERVMEHPTLRCDKCHHLFYEPVRYAEYFSSQNVICTNCGRPVDLFRMLSEALCKEIFPWESFRLVGAETSYFPIQMELKKIYPLKFSEHGIPEDSLILQVNFTVEGDGGLYPVHFENSLRQAGRFLPSFMPLYPCQFFAKKDNPVTRANIQVFVTWVRRSNDDFALSNLFDCFYYYHQGEYGKAMTYANVAVEEPLKKLCIKWLSSVASLDNVKRFIQDSATYSHQLNVLLPMFASVNDISLLSDDLRGNLNRIRRIRNKTAHEGGLPINLSKEETAPLVASALLGYVYIIWLSDRIYCLETC